ncbi:MAG: hypothetical protein WDW36_002491 [Sanguina aurantia]
MSTAQNLAGLAQGMDHVAAGAAAAGVSRLKTDPRVDGRNAMWVEKYRPQKLDNVAAHKETLETIKKLVAKNQLPHLLLYGPPGTGKTSTILALAREMYPGSFHNMVLELNASDDRGIGVVREEIQDFASTKTIFSNKHKLIILDECDAMTKDAQMALRRVIEKYTRNARFCLVCNYVSKVIPALQSRCTRFRFAPLPAQFVERRVREIADTESVKLGEGGLSALVTLGAGDMRRTLNILQSCHMAFDLIDESAVYTCTGNPLPRDIEQVVHWLFNEPMTSAFASEWRWTTGPGLDDPRVDPRVCVCLRRLWLTSYLMRRLRVGPAATHHEQPVAAPGSASCMASRCRQREALFRARVGERLAPSCPTGRRVRAVCCDASSSSRAHGHGGQQRDEEILSLQMTKGVALVDVVREIHPWMFRMSMPPKVKAVLVEKLADLEYRLAVGTSERLQLGGLVAAFVQAREDIGNAAQ